MSNHTSAASEPLTKPDDTQRRYVPVVPICVKKLKYKIDSGATPVPGCEDASADEAKASVRLCAKSDPDSFTKESHDDVSDSEDGYYQTAPTSPIEGTPPVGTIPPPTQDVPLHGTVHPVVLAASASQSTVTEATMQSTADLKVKAEEKQKARLQALSKAIPKEQVGLILDVRQMGN